MKKSILFATMIFCLLLSYPVIAGEKVRITNGEFPPLLSENLKYYGVTSRIITDAFALEGVEVEYGFFPWNRSLILAKRGEWDGSAVWAKSKEREEHFFFSIPVAHETVVFFHRKDKPFDWKSIKDLKGFNIGATLGYNYGEQFAELEQQGIIRTERVSTDETNFKKILGKRIDIFVCNIEAGYTLLNEMYEKETVDIFTNHSKPLRETPLCLILSKKNPKNEELIELFNRGMKGLQTSGKVDQYIEESRRGNYRP